MVVVWNSCGSFGPRALSRVSRSRVSDRPTTSNRVVARDSPSTSPSLSSFGTWRRRFSVWRPAASSRVWSRIDAPETALDAVAQPCQGSCPLQSTRENSLLRESYTNPRCHAKDPKTLDWTVSGPTLHLKARIRAETQALEGRDSTQDHGIDSRPTSNPRAFSAIACVRSPVRRQEFLIPSWTSLESEHLTSLNSISIDASRASLNFHQDARLDHPAEVVFHLNRRAASRDEDAKLHIDRERILSQVRRG